ncbi:nitrous oxide reductase family maturation protein NosD [Streptomyces sp. SAS_269]|uniref:right-handed parallel beta-helix repeat-containing protein n=1 Tax=Streptomyces sp. SAS_269 TaxID=3412749 RepID=UPI00403CAA7E
MFVRGSMATRRRLLPAAAMAVVAGATGLAGAAPAAAAPETQVNCTANPGALQPAINAASPGDTLRVRGTCTGPFTINKNLTLRGNGQAVLDGNSAGPTVTVGDLAGSQVQPTLDHLTITHGYAGVGGGIRNNPSATVTLINSTVEGNTAQYGGGIYTYGTVHLIRSTVKNNTAQGGPGGGIMTDTTVVVTLDNSTVERNSADDGGGGLYIRAGSTAALTHSTVKDNTAQFGGGVTTEGGTTLNLNHSTVKGNTASTQGGAIYNGGTVTLTHSTVERNTAQGGPGSGGGIYQQSSSATATLNNSRVRKNTPDNCAPSGSVPGCVG